MLSNDYIISEERKQCIYAFALKIKVFVLIKSKTEFFSLSRCADRCQ